MACIVVQIGQCGNQVGRHFWDFVDLSLTSSKDDYFDNPFILHNPINDNFYYRSINVDTEPKVIKTFADQNNNPACLFRPTCLIAERCGRGNNWAMGYYLGKLSHKDDIFERTMEELRKECERGSHHLGTIMAASVGGGTGSGVSSKLAELIKDEYPNRMLLSCAVTPFNDGDTPLQNYNSALAFSKLHQNCDAILLQHNDRIMTKAQKLIASSRSKCVPSLGDLNRLIAANIAGLFLPLGSNPNNYEQPVRYSINHVVRPMCKDGSNKFFTADSASGNFRSWEDAGESLINCLEPSKEIPNQQKINSKKRDNLNKNYLIIARGTSSLCLSELSAKTIDDRIRQACNIDLRANSNLWKSLKNPLSGNKSSTVSLSLAHKDIQCTKYYLKRTVNSAVEKFKVGAYLHWYERFGADQDDFKDAFHYLDTLLKYM